jgi:hypothetical protein
LCTQRRPFWSIKRMEAMNMAASPQCASNVPRGQWRFEMPACRKNIPVVVFDVPCPRVKTKRRHVSRDLAQGLHSFCFYFRVCCSKTTFRFALCDHIWPMQENHASLG